MAKGNRVKIGLKCSECGDINYSTVKNAKTTTEKLELKKFCPRFKQTYNSQRSEIEKLRGFSLGYFKQHRSVAPMVERRSPKPNVGGSSPSWPAIFGIKRDK